MQALLIPPIPELFRFGQGPMHLVLAQLLETSPSVPSRSARAYRSHYRQQADTGSHIILDNGAYEGGALHMSSLIDLAVDVHAKEVVIPDMLRNAGATLVMARDAVDEIARRPAFFNRGLVPMYVPQGETFYDWRQCMHELAYMHSVTLGDWPFSWGIATTYEEWPGGRERLLLTIEADLKYNDEFHPDAHLLGWSGSDHELRRIAQTIPWVRSVDSADPFKQAMGLVKRPPDYFERKLVGTQIVSARFHVARYVNWAQGLLR